jgi:hypothetical protein
LHSGEHRRFAALFYIESNQHPGGRGRFSLAKWWESLFSFLGLFRGWIFLGNDGGWRD